MAVFEPAPATVAILYPGTVLRVTEQTEAQHVFVMPEWNECEAREKSIADTSSAWRVSALRSVGYKTVVFSGRADDGEHVIFYRRLPDPTAH